MKMGRKTAVILEIALMIGMTFAISYIIGQSDANGTIIVQANSYSINTKGILLGILKIFDRVVFGNIGFASALTASDLQNGAYTCPVDKNGSLCQEYPASECNSKCSVSCLPTSADQTAGCQLGTCYDSVEGTCQVGSPQGVCQQNGGQWFDDSYGNIAQCKQGCCLIGSNSYFGTSQQCARDAKLTGLAKDFRPEINTELACLALSQTQVYGACVLQTSNSPQNSCKFTTGTDCTQNLKGKFYSGVLCSNPSLNTNCKPQSSISCVSGKDEVYWLDSCGNQENIYDANKAKSYNNGLVLSKSDSCSIASGANFLANQKTCGNCNYLLGSICGQSTGTQKLSDSNANVVCKDLSCVDDNGQKRANGESWCDYQGSIGLDKGAGGYLRSTDTVGSRDFRKTCINGEIQTDPCADYRNEICIESQIATQSGKFSSAACRLNQGYECYNYNESSKCLQNPDCFIKHVEVSKGFKFDVCAPKEVPGFDLTSRGEGSAAVCSIANQKCKVVYVNELFGGWTCKANCQCETAAFAEQMNDLCISLGDCGTKANYIGDLTKNSKVYKSNSKDKIGDEIGGKSELTNNYINKLVTYANDKLFKNKYIDAGNLSEFYSSLGIPGWVGQAQTPEDPTAGNAAIATTVAGAAGLALSGAAAAGIAVPGLVATYTTIVTTTATTTSGITTTGFLATVGPALTAVGGAIVAAGIGLAITTFLIQWTGVGAGLPPELTYTLMATGAIGAGLAGYSIFATTSIGIPLIGWGLFVLTIIFISVIAIIGIGDTKTIYYTFECNPWQAPVGGAKCTQCGSDGKLCSKYACQSLGQACQLVNEGTTSVACVNVGGNDATAPVITPASNLLPSGYTTKILQNGVQIKGPSSGCIPDDYAVIPFGINLNEYGQCRISAIHTSSFDNMEQTLDAGLYLQNHSLPLIIPSLASLGVNTANPNSTADYTIYLRCQDKNGNYNLNEYAINFCIKPGKDITPPLIISSEPYYKTVAFNATSINSIVYTNEPATCKWDTKDADYSFMMNSYDCATDFEQRTLYGWQCNTQLPFTGNSSVNYYVRCSDQPWLSGNNESQRNANTQSYTLTFTRSSKALNIDSINVDGKTLTFGVAPASVEVEVKTSGGLDGTAECAYVWGSTTINFLKTWSATHSQVFQSLFPGDITLPIICKDKIGNIAQKTAQFRINIDTSAPMVTRIYAQTGSLTVTTNEPSICYYSIDNSQKCLFDMGNASTLNGLYTNYHNIEFDTSKIYYIKCKDTLGNYPGSCSAVIRQGNYDSQQL